MKPITCLCSRFCASERGKLYHTYTMFIFWIMCIKKRETASYLHYVYFLDYVYQKEGNCIIHTTYLRPRFCVSECGKLHHINSTYMFYSLGIRKRKLYYTYSMFMFYVLCIRKRETVSYLQYVYDLDIVYQKVGNYIILTESK